MAPPSQDASAAPAVLVVDDIPAIRLFVRCVLEEAGFSVREAADGLEALSILTPQTDIDIVVTDLRMPRMDGWELGRKLASRSPRIPVLFISAFDAHSSVDLPGPVLAKPFMPEILISTIKELLLGRSEQSG